MDVLSSPRYDLWLSEFLQWYFVAKLKGFFFLFIFHFSYAIKIGKHEEKQDEHGYVARHFTRKYSLPQNYKADSVTSTLSSDGILTISVAQPEALPPSNQERPVTITHVGPSRPENQAVTQEAQQTKIEQVN